MAISVDTTADNLLENAGRRSPKRNVRTASIVDVDSASFVI
jgi:hypothetical protein